MPRYCRLSWSWPTTNDQRRSSNIEPGCNPHVFDVPQEPQAHLQRESHHAKQKKLSQRKLQQAHALEIFRHVAPEERIYEKASEHVIAADNNGAEYRLRHVRSDAKNVRQVAVHFINQPVVIPCLPRPEPLPARPSYERSDDDHSDPQNDEAKQKCSNRKLALLPGVIPAA